MRELQGRLIDRAIAIAGNPAKLCALLGVEEHRVRMWLQGRATLPDRIAIALIDLVLDDDIRRAGEDRRMGPRAARTVPRRVSP